MDSERPRKSSIGMVSSLKNLVDRITPNISRVSSFTNLTSGFSTAPEGKLFPKTDPIVDGEDCLHDCASCTIHYPPKFSIDEDDKLYGHVKGWSTHLVVATGKTDWVRDVADEKDSIMEAVDKRANKPSNGKLMLSASNMPLPTYTEGADPAATSVLLLPAFKIIDNVTPSSVPDLITDHVNQAPTNTTLLSVSASSLPNIASLNVSTSVIKESKLTTRPCPHRYLILLCSQKTRDARCGQSAPLLRREFERHLRPLGLYRDLNDERPGGCAIYFISHVGGHKYSANLMIYRRADTAGTAVSNGDAGDAGEEATEKEAAQCIWLARVKPEDCENIVKYTLLQGKVVKPESQLRGGFDRARGLVSW